MHDFYDSLVQAAEKLFEAIDSETQASFETDKDTPNHSPDYYVALQNMRKLVREFNAYKKRR